MSSDEKKRYDELSDEELIVLAKKSNDQEEDLHDVWFYQQHNDIVDGKESIHSKHLYFHYKEWSLDPVTFLVFIECLKLKNKNINYIYLNKLNCKIDINKLVGDYVKSQKNKKKKRLRKVSSIKS